uniref:Vacuolar protein sorting-associated protein VTA1 homolog n=1 Tax=Phallusia mammillata TaxID=59560 RepID=A0A6F9DXR0_9ASCI|nr:vacuolar protein sorting-associated protein VTA1 homolog [Phallusia mammillata]
MESLLPIPAFLKSIRPYVKVAIEINRQDKLVSYYCCYYALQVGLKTQYKTSPESKLYLTKLMGFQENLHKEIKADPELNEGLDDMTGQAVVEAAANKLFNWADGQDRKSIFNKQVVKSFYTSSILFDVLDVFKEETSDEIKTQHKYARWKATYIHNCLKNNETPQPGPIGEFEDEFGSVGVSQGEQPSTSHSDSGGTSGGGYVAPEMSAQPMPAPRKQSAPEPEETQYADTVPTAQSGANLTQKDFSDAEKLCKYAGSALQYKDVATATDYLEKCLRLLRTGKQ